MVYGVESSSVIALRRALKIVSKRIVALVLV